MLGQLLGKMGKWHLTLPPKRSRKHRRKFHQEPLKPKEMMVGTRALMAKICMVRPVRHQGKAAPSDPAACAQVHRSLFVGDFLSVFSLVMEDGSPRVS